MSATPLQMQSFFNQQNRAAGAGSNNRGVFTSPPPSSSRTGHHQQQPSSPYLPGYLLGNSPGHHHTPSPGGGNSSRLAQPPNPLRLSSGTTFNSPGDSYKLQQQQQQHKQTHAASGRQSIVKEGAPPTESLYSPLSANGTEDLQMDTDAALPFKSFSHSLNESVLSPQHNHTLNDSVFSPRKDLIPQSPAQIDPFYTQGESITSEDVVDESAVTVFGFPPAASSYILQEFSQYGTIECSEIHNTGNWLHIKYQTRIQAKKALSKNGKCFAQTIMIGVLPCIKRQIGTNVNETTTLGSVPDTPKQLINNKKPSTMRPLSATPSRNSGAATPDPFLQNNTPQKSDSVMSKALDYVFGW